MDNTVKRILEDNGFTVHTSALKAIYIDILRS